AERRGRRGAWARGARGRGGPRGGGPAARCGPRPAELARGARSAPLAPAQSPAGAGGRAERVVGVARGALRTRRPVAPACKIERIPVSALFAGSSGRGRHMTLQRLSFDPGLHLAAASAEPVTAYGAMVRGVFRGSVMPVGCIDTVFGYLPTAAMVGERGYEDSGFTRSFGLAGRL